LKKWAKKGAAIIKFDVYDTSVAFINCHLTSEIDNTNYRISDLKQIFKTIDLSNSSVIGDSVQINLEEDNICLFGNLNFRLNMTVGQSSLLIEDYNQCIYDNSYEKARTKLDTLKMSDQLNDAKIQ